ncbi:hypothetical protein GCM10023063_41750 [Arthrobacter methylotrophus]|uniref:Uncharacterized protein n=2 Tax=Arthrobacter methylotrophus TaxID=121291 RepID=A0ABV5UPZ5_9MICC
MLDPRSRDTLGVLVPVLQWRRFVLSPRLRQALSRAAELAKAASSPFKVGDYVSGDDPFNGCQEGVVTAINGSSIGLRTTAPTAGAVVYYDYRQLRKPW